MTAAHLDAHSPAPPARSSRAPALGYGGLLPFVGGAALLWLVRPELQPWVEAALTAYAAVIVSFLGGIHWGLALRLATPPAVLLVWGVVPSLVAWLAVLMAPQAGLVVLGAMLLLCYAVDRRLYPPQGLAHWLVLRFRLSAVAALSCFVAAAHG